MIKRGTCFFLLLSLFSNGAESASPKAASFQQPIFKDSLYLQDYSIKYTVDVARYGDSIGFKKVVCDRNGVVKIYSSAGILSKSGGQLLHPGELVPDISYLPTVDQQIKNMGLYNKQFVYATDKAVLSNAWAGKLYSRHTIPGISLFCGGEDFSFLLSDGHKIQYIKDSALLSELQVADQLVDILFDTKKNYFWLLGQHSISVFDPATKSVQEKYKGEGLTCFALTGNSREIIVGTHNGYFKLNAASGEKIGSINNKLPCADLTVVKEIGRNTWFGSLHGAFFIQPNGQFKYYASKRWLPSDSVTDIAAGNDNSVLILTNKGMSEIHFDLITLADKARYFERQVRERHIRLGFNATISRMKNGDVNTGSLEDSDNDGLWTSMYLGAEVFRYAATRSAEALENCRESLDAMERLYTVNQVKGFPARSFERRGYEISDTMAWKQSEQPGWDWKSTTSSDEAVGHMFVFGVIAELVDAPALKSKAIHLMDALMQHIVDKRLYLVDWDGKPTRWGRWNPEYVNAMPKNVGDRKITSSNIISMLQTAWHFTHKKIYRDKALELLNKYDYLDNLMRPMKEIGQAPDDAAALAKILSDGWNHSDDEMYFLGYWGLYRYALNDALKAKFKIAIIDHWQIERPEKEAAWNIFTAITGVQQFRLEDAVWYLQKYPMDLVDWRVKNSDRKDIHFIAPNFRGQTTDEVLPPDELPVSRHNANRFDLDGGDENGGSEYSAGDIWLLPYWMGRYLKLIAGPVKKSGAAIK